MKKTSMLNPVKTLGYIKCHRFEFLDMITSFALSDTEDNTSGPSNEGRSRFTSVKNTIVNFPKVTRAKFLGDDSFILLAISKFSSLKKTITRLSELQLDVDLF